MTDPVIGVKYRIQNVDYLTYVEALDQGTVTGVRLRPEKESPFQYWVFETVPSNTGFYYVRNVGNNARCLYCDGSSITANTPSTTYSMAKVSHENGSYRLTVRCSTTDYYVDPDDYGAYVKAASKNETNKQRWQLVPVGSPASKPIYAGVLQTGNYRVRNLNGESLLTLPDAKSVGSASLFVRSQRGDSDTLKTWQRWIITRQESGQYTIQNAGDSSYLGCSVPKPTVGDKVVGLTNVYLWDIKSIGGFAWTILLPTGGLSVGVGDNDIEDEDEMTLVSSDNTSSQIWFMETYIPLGNDVIYAKREVAEGTYLLQSAHDPSIYMKALSAPWRITPVTTAPSKFKLEYVNEKSAHFKLTYTETTKNPITKVVANRGGYIGLDDDGSDFVILEKDKGDPGYVICLPDHGYPHKVVSNRSKDDGNGNSVFSIDNKVTGEALQMWKLVVPTS